MNGPAPIPPPRRGARAARVILRVLLVAVPPATIGILSWIPMLRLAVRSRRAWDWLWCGLVVVLATGAFVLVGQSDDDNGWQTALGTAGLILLAFGVPVYFLVADLRWYDAHRSRAAGSGAAASVVAASGVASPTDLLGAGRPPVAPAPAAPSGRIDRVRAELDELSAYLRNQEGA